MAGKLRHMFFLLLLLATVVGFSQQELLTAGYENGTNLNILYKTTRVGKIFGTPRGYGITYRYGKHLTAQRSIYYDFEIQNLRHPKERKVSGAASTKKRYVYGKLNSVCEVRGAIGLQHVLFKKADNKAVEVRYSYSAGPLLAFVKPYYLMLYNGRMIGTPIKFDASSFDPTSSILGRAGFSQGLDETKLLPGVTAKFNLSFEYAPFTNLVRAIETGIAIDYYPKALTIMANNPSEHFIITFNVGFVFGRKWY